MIPSRPGMQFSLMVATVSACLSSRKMALYVTATLIGLSRIYLDVHYVSEDRGAVYAVGWGLFRIEPAISRVETKLSSPVKKRFTWASTGAVLGLTLISAVLFFYQLGSFTLTDVDEGVYAAATQEMIATGDLITPHYNGANRYDKPILFYWLMAVAYSLFGVNEFAARFWSALLGVGLVLMTFLFAKRYGGIKLGLTAALILATSLETIALAHGALLT
jgi:hypothetical protein